MKAIKYIVQTALGLVLSFGVMYYQGLFEAATAADRIRIVCDGFSVTALLFFSMGFIVWVSTTGFFDIFGYALKKGAHALVPGLVRKDVQDFYEYKLEKQGGRKKRGEGSTLLLGLGFLLAGLILTGVWYGLA